MLLRWPLIICHPRRHSHVAFPPIYEEISCRRTYCSCSSLSSKSKQHGYNAGLLTSYAQVVNHLMEIYATDDVIEEKDTKIMRFTQPLTCRLWDLQMPCGWRNYVTHTFMMSTRWKWRSLKVFCGLFATASDLIGAAIWVLHYRSWCSKQHRWGNYKR